MIKEIKNGKYQYDMKDELGRGAFATVYKGIIKDSNKIIAIKVIDKHKI